MGSGLTLIPILNWIDYLFPSLTTYTTTLGPLIVVLIGLASIFSNILPIPGMVYPVPDKLDIDIELQDSNILILYSAKVARVITIHINWIVSTTLYKGFFHSTKYTASIIVYMRLSKSLNALALISVPTTHVHEDSAPEARNDEYIDDKH